MSRGKVLLLGKCKDKRVWRHPVALPFAPMARELQHTRAAPLFDGHYESFETNRWYKYKADGTVDVVAAFRADGVRTTEAVRINVEALEQFAHDPELAAGIADFTADFSEDVVEDTADVCSDKKVQLAVASLKALDELAKDKVAKHTEHLQGLLDAAKEQLAKDVKLYELTGLTELPDTNPSASYLNNPESPGFEPGRRSFFSCRSHSGRGIDALKDKTRDDFDKNDKEIKKAIVRARFPGLVGIDGGEEVIANLAAVAQIDHVYSGGYCHPANLFVDFRGPNQTFDAHRFQRGKWEYYGEYVMEAAAAWIKLAVSAVDVVVSV